MPNDAYALSSMVLELTGTSLGAIFRCKIFNKIRPMANAYWMTDADGVSNPTAGLFLTARDWALVANFNQESINQNNCMGKYLKEDINSASKSSSTKWWKFGYHFWTTKIESQSIIIFAGYGRHAIFINPKTQTVVIASSVNPKYRLSKVFKQVQKIFKKAVQ